MFDLISVQNTMWGAYHGFPVNTPRLYFSENFH